MHSFQRRLILDGGSRILLGIKGTNCIPFILQFKWLSKKMGGLIGITWETIPRECEVRKYWRSIFRLKESGILKHVYFDSPSFPIAFYRDS